MDKNNCFNTGCAHRTRNKMAGSLWKKYAGSEIFLQEATTVGKSLTETVTHYIGGKNTLHTGAKTH